MWINEQHYKDRQAEASEHLFKLLQSEPDEWDGRGDDGVVAEIFQSYAKSTAEREFLSVYGLQSSAWSGCW